MKWYWFVPDLLVITWTIELLRPYSTLYTFTCTVVSCSVSGLGTKFSTPSRNVQVNAAVYWYDYRNKQLLTYFKDPIFGALQYLQNVPKSLDEVERTHIERTLRAHTGNRTHTARELGISRATLIKKIKAYGL